MAYPIGTKVYYLVNSSRASGPCLAEGKVRHYIRTSKCYTVDVIDGDTGTVHVVSTRYAVKKSKRGKNKILLMIIRQYEAAIAYHNQRIAECEKEIAKLVQQT